MELPLSVLGAWQLLRHGDVTHVPLGYAVDGVPVPALRLEELALLASRGFHVLVDDPPRELVIGAIGKLWDLELPFLRITKPHEVEAFAEPGWIKLVWGLSIETASVHSSRVTIELRIDATDDASWQRLERDGIGGARAHGPETPPPLRDLVTRRLRRLRGEPWREVVGNLGEVARHAYAYLRQGHGPRVSGWSSVEDRT
ncbi:MAG TPA: hypothetical protein VFQ53_11400 [Kofleriaceae bacterium]|nr:hypothetical protein [Kofleriaceae bacterium]